MPIEHTGLYWLGFLALLLQFGGLVSAVSRYRQNEASIEGLFAFGFAMALWGGFTISSFGYYITTNAAVVISRSSQMLALIGLMGLATTLVLLMDGAMRAIRSNA
jgi:hypothetical protein